MFGTRAAWCSIWRFRGLGRQALLKDSYSTLGVKYIIIFEFVRHDEVEIGVCRRRKSGLSQKRGIWAQARGNLPCGGEALLV